MKKICIVYGNCQIEPLRKYLMSSSAFKAIYKMVDVPSVHECNLETGLAKQYLKQLYRCDLFIYQKVSTSYSYYLSDEYILSKLPNKCTRLSFTNTYFSGYHPQYVRGKIDPYCDKNIIKLLNEGKSKEEIIAILSDDNFYSFHEANTNFAATLNELKRRESQLDLTLDNFIEQNYRHTHLFYTINHPNYHITRYLAMKILAKLGLPEKEITHIVHEPDFRKYMQPIYPSVIKHLNLRFIKPEDKYFTFDRDFKFLQPPPLTFGEYIAEHIDFLKNSGELQA